MELFKELTIQEKEDLLKYPVYLSLLVADGDGIKDEIEIKQVVKFLHKKSYCHPLLSEYFIEVDQVFTDKLEQIDNELPKGKEKRETVIRKELSRLARIVLKLDKEYSSIMKYSMKLYKEQLFQARHSVLVNFIVPCPYD